MMMRRRSLIQRIATDHNSMEDIGYAVETLELARGAIIDSLRSSKLHVGEILPRFTEAAKAKKLEWLDCARSLLDSRKLVYLSSAQKEVALTEGLKREQLRHYEVRIDESVAAQKRLLLRVQDQEDARELLADLAVNFTEKLRQYQTMLDNKSQHIDLLETKDDQKDDWETNDNPTPASPDVFARPRRKRTFYLGGDDDDEEDEEEDDVEVARTVLRNPRQGDIDTRSIESQDDRASNCMPSLGSLETLPDDEDDEEEDEVGHANHPPSYSHYHQQQPQQEPQEDEDEEFFLSFNKRPAHGREDSGGDEVFNNPPFKLHPERPHSPGLFSKLREQFRGFVPFATPAPQRPSPLQRGKETKVEDVVQLYWACERSLPYCVYQVLFYTKPEKRRALANAPSTTESSHGPLHAACRQGHSLIVKILLTFGADPTLVSAEGYSPLHYAAESGNLELVSILLATAKEDPAKTTQLLEGPLLGKSGYTPLTIAAIKGDLSLAKLLLTKTQALPLAMGQKLTRRLLKTVCTHESLELRGSPLEIATLYGHREMVLFLLAQGAEPLVKEVEYTVAHPSTLHYVTIGLHRR